METPTITLNDGSVYNAETTVNSLSETIIILTIEPMALSEGIRVFSDSNKTSKITINRPFTEPVELTGYTSLIEMMNYPNGTLRVELKRA